jgi:CRP/FNR family cyclic AMP-dependent transcriptional regulator
MVMVNQVPLFAGLSPEELETIERHAVTKRYRKNTVIIEKGDEANSLYLILEGRVKVYVADEEGKEIVLNEQGPGDHIGELALLGDTLRTASVITLEDSVFLVLTKRSFRQCLDDHPGIALNLLGYLSHRVGQLTEEVSDLALLDVYGRVAKTLIESATEQDGRLVTSRLTHQEIADRVGSSREMVSKILKDLRTGGYVTVEGKQYVINRKLPTRW